MELTKKYLYTIRNKIFSSNTYILKSEINDTCLIIDPGLDTIQIDSVIQKLNVLPLAILATHGHFDHVGSVSFLKNKYNIPFYLHERDVKMCQSANFYLKMAHLNHTIETPIPDFLFQGAFKRLTINDFELNIYNLPGHSNGSCIIQIENYLFSGDTIYKEGIGLGSIPRENIPLLKESLLKIFKLFADEDIILPGHGASEYLSIIKNDNIPLKIFLTNNNEGNKL